MRNRTRLRNAGRRVLSAGGAAAPAPAWTPASLPSLAAWYTAGPSWCFTDAAGTVPCDDGDLVRVWKDRSGNARDLTQGTSANRPTHTLAGDGRWEVVFDGVNDWTQAAFALPQPADLWAVARFTGPHAALNETLFDGAGGDNRMRVFRPDETTLHTFAGTFGPVATVADTTIRHAYRFAFDGASSLAAADAAAAATGDVGAAVPSGLTVAAVAASHNEFGPVAGSEIVLSAAVLAAGDAASLWAYLKSTWGTP